MNFRISSRRARVIALLTSVAALGALVVAVPQAAISGPSVVIQTFSYTGSVGSFTVPTGISSLTITATGGEGGNGGADATPAPPAGGYRGVVTGTISVTPGQVLTMGVGSGGATGLSNKNASSGNAAAGSNPISGYAGGRGGAAGTAGSSGQGGAGGAASVIQIAGTSVVAGGGGGNGGSGQFASTRGRTATASYLGRTDTVTGTGQAGINANDACIQTSCSNNDGGGSGGGGGGSLGGTQGAIEFGAGTSNEWFGYGGSVGQNSTGSLSGLSASYQYYSNNGAAGSVVISYSTGSPAAPSAVSGTAADGAVNLIWTAPADSGQSVISNYVAQFSINGGASWSGPVDLGTTGTAGTVTGLSNGTAHIFQVAAVNSVGTGIYSASSSPVTPLGLPTAPTISSVTAQDGALSLVLVAPSSGAPVTGYDYRVDGGSWIAVASPSTSIVIPGLINGTSYSVEVRAESSVGAGAISAPASGTPLAVPGAPTIGSLAVDNGALSVAFTSGFSGGGAATSYEYQLNGGSWTTASGTSSPIQITGLADGTDYSVALRAVNSVGAGAASAPATATTPALPGAPTISSVIAGDGAALVSFAPGTTGGSPIQGYEYQTTSGGAWAAVPGSSSPVLITRLTNGTAYAVKIRGLNSVGTGTASAAVAVTPATVPSAPSIVGDTVAGSDATLSAAFTVPADDGGSAITTYEYSTDAGETWRTRDDSGGTSSPVVITAESSDGSTPLTNGDTYGVELRAVNAIGAGTASAVASGIATTVPSQPTITGVAPSSGSLGVSFTAGSNGGSAITSYEYSIDNGSHWVATGTLGTSFVASGLSNGTAYPVQVRAINSVGGGVVSAVVTGTPVGLPGQASISEVVRSNQTLTVSVSVVDTGGSPATAWEYSTDAGTSWSTASGTVSPLTLTSLSADGTTRLANGTGYALQVRAVTEIGSGPASATTIVAPASAPAAPSIAVTARNSSVSVAFTWGTDGGSPVTQLEYTIDDGSSWKSTGTLSSPFTIGGLNNGTVYTIRLRAVNAIGNGAPSVLASTTPRTVPGAPGSVVAASNSASADVTWVAPAVTGGAPITGYTVSAYTSSASTTAVSTCSTSGATSCSLPSLTNGTQYYVGVTATNTAGAGAASAPRVLVTPLVRPAEPTLNSLSVGDGSISAAFTAGNAGDRAIVGYQYSVDGGSTWTPASAMSSPILISGLTNGTTYTVALRAVSSAGVGDTSNTKQATPFTYPSAPATATIVANGGDGQIIVTWEAANLNGGNLLNYTATAFTGLTSGSTARTCTTTGLSCTLPSLSNGTTYYVSLQTQNTASMYSERSAPRVAATPSPQPGAVTNVTATGGDATAAVSWTAPMSTGASAITGYTVWCSADGGAYAQCAASTTASAEVTSLTNGSSYTFTVFTTNSSGTGPVSVASSAVTPLGAGTTPVLAVATPTASGFTSMITNYDTATNYSATATNGATVVLKGSTLTVSGLSNGATSRVTVTATKPAMTTTTVLLAGAALLTGIAPTFSGNVATATGFGFTITNYDSAATYTLASGSGATATRSGAAVTVTGLALDGSSAVTVEVTKSGSTSASASNSGAAMVAGTAPTFTNLVSTETGYQVDISNYNSSLSYVLDVTGGATATRSAATINVTGLSDGESADVTVTATDPAVSVATASQTGAALLAGTAPIESAVTQTADGFSFTIINPDLASGYTVTVSGGVVGLSGTTVTVTGLAAGESADVTVNVTKSGYVTIPVVVSASALLAGLTPLFGVPTRTVDGYAFTLSNFDARGSYLLSSSTGAATISGATVTVTGLEPAAGSRVTVTVSRAGYTDAVAAQSGTAINAGVAPTLSGTVATTGGFIFTITNYSTAFSYALSTSAGTITRNGDRVTVTGLGAGVKAVAQIVATQTGYQAASTRVTGGAAASIRVPGGVAAPAPALSDTSSVVETPRDAANSPSSPSLLAPLRESKAGMAAVTSDGGEVSSKLTTSKNTVTVRASNGLTLTVAAKRDGITLPLSADGVVEVQRSGQLWVTVSGLDPQSAMVVWSMGSKDELAVSQANASGETATRVFLPISLTPGVQTLVVTGVDARGESVTMQVGIRVLDAQNASASSPFASTWWIWLGAALVLFMLFVWFVLAGRRGRRS
ncbi:fibronectin type III [Leifsonia rubra CMS 76R]|nr:fibronectin type III [Leifsonia rubra CMS 76R]